MTFLKKKWDSLSNMHHLTPHTIALDYIDHDHPFLSLAQQAELLGISTSSLYYQPVPIHSQDKDMMDRMDKIHTDWPTYGARKIAKELMRQYRSEHVAIAIGRKRIRSLMERMGIGAIYTKPNLSANTTPHPIYPYLLSNITASYPNHIWGMDITYIRTHGSFLYLVAIIDWYSRFVVAHTLSTSLDTAFCLDTAKNALSIAIPSIINVDQGVQFTSDAFIGLWNQERTRISMDHKGRCFDNIFTERFWRTLKYDEVYLKDYRTMREAQMSIDDYIRRYNFMRLHEALGYKTPAEVYGEDALLWEDFRRKLFVN